MAVKQILVTLTIHSVQGYSEAINFLIGSEYDIQIGKSNRGVFFNAS
jgi:hypothetical protein